MTDTNGDNGNGGKNSNAPMEAPSEEELDGLELSDEEDDEEESFYEYMAGLFTEALQEGVPVRFSAHMADPFVQPVLQRMEMQNALLHDIAKSLRVLAKRAVDAPFDVSIQLKKKQ
jgi:hypothetical protein